MDKWEKLKLAVADLKENLDIYCADAQANGDVSIMSNEWLAQLDEIFKAAYGLDDEIVSICME